MEYVSVKETAQAWGISTARVVLLAQQGRIRGAKLVGKSWLIPRFAEKPQDMRRKDARAAAKSKPPEDNFRFPMYLYAALTPSIIETQFTDEQKALYRAQVLCSNGEFREAYDILESLRLNTTDIPIRIGTLYYEALTSIYLKKYDKFSRLLMEMDRLFQRDFTHKEELSYILNELRTYSTGDRFYIKTFSLKPGMPYHADSYIYLYVESAYATALRGLMDRSPTDPAAFEVGCSVMERQGFDTAARDLHLYLALIYRDLLNPEAMYLHIRRAVEISFQHKRMGKAAVYYTYMPNEFEVVFSEMDPAIGTRLRALNHQMFEAYQGLLEHRNTGFIYRLFEREDYEYISYAVQGITYSKIAAMKHLSVNTISKKYQAIFKKTGVSNKREFTDLCLKYLNEFLP